MVSQMGVVSTAMVIACLAGPPLLAQCGDYNGDGFDDLPAGTGWEDVNGVADAGAVNVIYGTGNGLKADGDQLFTRATPGINGSLVPFAYFGMALASGDFDGDGFDDLAVSAGEETIDGVLDAGSVSVIYGRGSGLSATGDQRWHQGVAGIAGPVGLHQFGWSLAAGDFDGDGFDDLAIGAPLEGLGGAVHVLYGSASGLRAAGDQMFTQDTAGVLDSVELDESFGWSLAAGDFDGDGRDDLAIGVPFERNSGGFGAGAVAVLYGTPGGLSAAGDQLWSQDSPGIADVAESQDDFGWSLCTGDFDGDGRDDLAVGVVGQDLDGANAAGAVAVLYGTSSGLSANGDDLWHQDKPGIRNAPGMNEYFGWWLAAGDFDGDGRDELAIAVMGEDVDGLEQAGAVAVLRGTNSGLTAAGDVLIHQNSPGVNGAASLNGRFAANLYVGDFDNDGFDDLAIAKINQNVGSAVSAGSLTVLYGSAGGASAAGDQVWTQDSAGIKDNAETADLFGTLLVPIHE